MDNDNVNQPSKFIGNKVSGIVSILPISRFPQPSSSLQTLSVHSRFKLTISKKKKKLFENKCDHATFFDGHLYAIQGIHMIPINPSSALTRTKRFVQEEWDAYFRAGGAEPVANVNNGWKGIIYANRALIDPNDSWNFFSQPGFNDSVWLDDGASRTWYLAYAAGMLKTVSDR
jgi:endoglucanase Acf2